MIPLAVLLGITGLLITVGFLLIRYGEKNQKAKTTEVELKIAKQNMEAARAVALDAPVSDDDILARLRGNKDS